MTVLFLTLFSLWWRRKKNKKKLFFLLFSRVIVTTLYCYLFYSSVVHLDIFSKRKRALFESAIMDDIVTEESHTIMNESSVDPTSDTRQTTAVICECKICGAPARYSYYGAIVCHSCKMFFKRNAEMKE
jgi:hypothetical protein